MTSQELRKKFLDFFSGYNHIVVASSSLVPEKDPTLLFVNAGMVQFKNVFLGIEKRAYRRATSCQKCVRAGGKHNDLENIGKTLRHHTFFEMLGNFSFGDYFKEEAIAYAWEFLTNKLMLETKRLWITIFRDDEKAFALWKKMGVKEERIVRFGEKDNFWSMGDEGPCGPCSEVIYDIGENAGCGKPTCGVGCDCDRYLEIWNLVFMEFERMKDGTMKKLPHPSIDTGMGLERITSVMQGKIGNYETDLFIPVLRHIEDISRCVYGEDKQIDTAMRVIADHARSTTFIINDGVLPSKDGRGYVLRRIIRRALRYGKKLGIEKEFLYTLSGTVVDVMKDVYPDVANNHPYIVRVIKSEEERFVETLNTGMRLYEDIVSTLRSKGDITIPGDVVFKLYDTYGFPLDITIEMAEEDGLRVDIKGFEAAAQEQKERSRISSRIKGDTIEESHAVALKEGIRSVFVGYGGKTEETGFITAIVVDASSVDTISEGQRGELFFDRTPFYAESGGQVGDEGFITGSTGKAKVTGVKKIKEELFSHEVEVVHGVLKKGDRVELMVDRDKRMGTSRNHTATHLLHYALRRVLGDHVKQSGSKVDHDRLRFDFTHYQAMDEKEIAKVEDIVNEKIMACVDVVTEVKNREDAIREGAIALFEEKYGERVRVIRIGNFSTELCGGTHVSNTGEIGSFYIVSESSLASGIRRIEAVTGKGATLLKRKMEGIINGIMKITNTERERIQERVEGLINELSSKTKEIERLQEELLRYKVDEAIQGALEKDGAKIMSLFVPGATVEDLRKVTDIIRSKVKTCVALVGSKEDSKGILIIAVSKDLASTYNAGKIIKKLTEKYGGKGGGGNQIAQGGVPAEKVFDALKDIKSILDTL